VRQLRNIVEQMSVIEQQRDVDSRTLRHYLPEEVSGLVPMGVSSNVPGSLDSINERELIFKFLFDMKSDLSALKEQVKALSSGQPLPTNIQPTYRDELIMPQSTVPGTMSIQMPGQLDEDVDHTEVEETLSIEVKEKELIRKALVKHRNRRKNAAQELGISERTLYRKIKEYDIP
jgi:DNA-binding NtrC family response regulator